MNIDAMSTHDFWSLELNDLFNQTLENIKIIDYYFLVSQKYVNNTLQLLYICNKLRMKSLAWMC